MADGPVNVSVAMVTHNRRVELERSLTSVYAQEDVVLDVIVVDDGSSDGTSEMVADRFPSARLVRQDLAQGCAVSRNVATESALAEIIVYLDDDAEFPSPRTVRQTLDYFDEPRVAVVAIPFEDVLPEGSVMRQRAASDTGVWVQPTFVAAAWAVRAEIFRRVGGFGSAYHNMYGEEADLSLRLLSMGCVVRVGRADPAVHRPSAARSVARMDLLGRRNELVWAWSSFPAPWHLVYMVGYVIKGLLWGVRTRRPRNMIKGLALGARALPSTRRQPVSRRAFRADRRLRRRGSLPLASLEPDLPERVP